jgi:hypothetical protein
MTHMGEVTRQGQRSRQIDRSTALGALAAGRGVPEHAPQKRTGAATRRVAEVPLKDRANVA